MLLSASTPGTSPCCRGRLYQIQSLCLNGWSFPSPKGEMGLKFFLMGVCGCMGTGKASGVIVSCGSQLREARGRTVRCIKCEQCCLQPRWSGNCFCVCDKLCLYSLLISYSTYRYFFVFLNIYIYVFIDFMMDLLQTLFSCIKVDIGGLIKLVTLSVNA